jgi:hypothetical protein
VKIPDSKIIGLAGPKGVGKTTLAGELIGDKGSVISFADPIKQMARHILLALGCKPAVKWLSIWKERQVPGLPAGITPRVMLQLIGTELGRNLLDPDIWVKAGMGKAKPVWRKGGIVVFDDVRFENEARAIKELDGEIWLIQRKGYFPPLDSHISEKGLPLSLIDKKHWVKYEDDQSI